MHGFNYYWAADVIGNKMSIDPVEVELTRSLSIVRAPLHLRQDCAFGIEEGVVMALID